MGQDTEVLFVITVIVLLPVMMFSLLIWGGRIVQWIAQNVIQTSPCKNPLVGDTRENRYHEWVCKQSGCVTTAEVYYIGMPQATCRRCGG